MSALLLLALACQDVDALIQQLGAESYADREAAMKSLSAMGTKIEKPLRPHLKHRDPEIQRRVTKLIDAIDQANLAKKLVLSVEPDGDQFRIQLTNHSKHPQILHAGEGFYTSVKYKGEQSLGIGSGFAGSRCNLSAGSFSTVKPGEVLELKPFVPEKGKVVEELRVGYSFVAERYKSRCKKACACHSDPEMPWNKAAEVKLNHSWPPKKKK